MRQNRKAETVGIGFGMPGEYMFRDDPTALNPRATQTDV
jgi:hypothetical protein